MDTSWYGVMVVMLLFLIAMLLLLYLASKLRTKEQPPVIGTILIETSDPDGPFLFLDLEMPVEQIGTYTEVKCRVNTNGVTGNESE